ncbi:MAG: class I SAM-dependent methyltransferase [Bacteroidales bacterium]|nr:class I SAM-dependent methyltransferase [Bacteroidales bacterium]
MDKTYWEEFYAQQNAEYEPSLFAQFVAAKIKANSKIIELGCGNGRDSVYFASKNFIIKAVDQCERQIEFMKAKYSNIKNIDFLTADFTALSEESKFDVIYSRFTLHSISKEQEDKVCTWAYNSLSTNGFFCIEVRGQKNEIYCKGNKVEGEEDAYIYNNHYRRFLNFDTFCNKLKTIGFALDYAEEKKGFAPFKGTDETYMRVIAVKKNNE